VRAYTPKKTAQWEGAAASTLMDQWCARPLDGPVSVGILALFPRPQRMIWKRKPMDREPYCQKPDTDNVVKAVLDAMEKAGVVMNDKQVWSVDCVALYCSGDESPRVEVRVGW
jgi:Holliday junction resolvase RusA-like endonuclease